MNGLANEGRRGRGRRVDYDLRTKLPERTTMRGVKTSWNASLTRAGNVKVSTRTKVPMLPALRTSTTLGTAAPKRKRKKR